MTPDVQTQTQTEIQKLRTKLIARRMAVDAIPEGSADPFGSGVKFILSGKLLSSYKNAEKWLDGVRELMRTAPDNPYESDEAFMKDLLQKIECRDRENLQRFRSEESRSK